MALLDEVRALRQKATPGQWRWRSEGGTRWIIEGDYPPGPCVLRASVVRACVGRDNGEMLGSGHMAPLTADLPDAVLIAAAPTLAAKLERALELLSDGATNVHSWHMEEMPAWAAAADSLLADSLTDAGLGT